MKVAFIHDNVLFELKSETGYMHEMKFEVIFVCYFEVVIIMKVLK